MIRSPGSVSRTIQIDSRTFPGPSAYARRPAVGSTCTGKCQPRPSSAMLIGQPSVGRSYERDLRARDGLLPLDPGREVRPLLRLRQPGVELRERLVAELLQLGLGRGA